MQVQNLFEPNETITFESYLNKMGIDNIQKYLHPPTTVLDSCYIYDNIREGVQILKYHILNDDRIAIVQDADTDGSCSAYMIYKALKLHGVSKVKPFIQNGKERGIESKSMRDKLLEWQPNLIIIPDAGTNSVQWEDEFIDNGIDLLIIDHHEADERVCKHATVINNTTNQLECSRSLSGTGVTFKVIQALDYEMGTKYSNRFIDLVGISIISDSMDVRTYENRWFLKYILDDKKHIENPFIYELFDSLLGDEYTQRDISFRIVPLFNSVIRCGTLEEKQQLFMAFCGKNIDDTIKMCQRYHSEQIKRVDDFIRHHQEEIDAQKDSNITIIDAQDCIKSFNGLIAGRISGMTNKPCIVGRVVGNELCGSFRGYINVNVMSNLPHVTMAQGHETGAYGIKIEVGDSDTSKSQNLADFRAEIDKMDISTVPTVISSYSANKLQMGLFNEFVGNNDLWGEELDKPRFYIYNIKVNSKHFKLMGSKQDTLKIPQMGYEIMFFKLSEQKKEMLRIGEDVELNINIIGNLNVNRWQSKKTNQILVEDFEVEEITNTFEDLM
jgi:single-stranded-DNA-specific exonuclease